MGSAYCLTGEEHLSAYQRIAIIESGDMGQTRIKGAKHDIEV